MKGSALADQFTQHHKQFTQGLHHILQLLKEGKVSEAVEEADALDQLAGPHIEFEEKVYYPQVARSLGKDFIDHLYDEHRIGQKALRTLLHAKDAQIGPGEQAKLVREFQIALDHAASCGTLLSHLTALPEEEQNKFLEQLFDFNRQGHRWTELPE